MVYIHPDSTNPALDLFLLQMASQYSLAKRYRAGEVLFREGQTGNTMLLVLQGALEIRKRLEDSESLRTIATRGPGDFLGEMAIVEESPRFATVVALSDCEVLEFTRKNFERAIQEQPALAVRVLRSLSGKLRESDSSRILELEDNNRALAASNAELTTLNYFLDRLIEESPSAVLIVLRTGEIFRLNRAAGRMFELTDDASSLTIGDLLPDLRLSSSGTAPGDSRHVEVTGRRKGVPFPVLSSVSVIRGSDEGSLYLVICQDLSELQALNETILAVEKHGAARDVVAEVAHDIKNYLAVISGHFQLMQARLTAEQKERSANSISAIESTTAQALSFLEDAMVRDRHTDSATRVDVINLVQTLLRFCRSQSLFSEMELGFKADPGFPRTVRTVEDLVRRVVLNLLLNSAEALKGIERAEKKAVSVHLAWNETGKLVIIRVEDNGPGIAEEHLEKVFRQRFTTKKTGHGIGLVSVARSLESQGGTITVASTVGQGTVFEITLPVQVESSHA